MSQDERMTEAVRRVREAAVNEAERLFVRAAADLKASPAQLGAIEKDVRNGVLSIGAAILAGAMHLWGTGYAGSRKVCACGETQKYMNDRNRRVVSLLGAFRFKRAYYWCPACGASDAPMDHFFQIAHTDFSPAVREAVSLVGAEVAFGRGRSLMGDLTGIWVSKRKHREISEATGARLAPPDATVSDHAGPPCGSPTPSIPLRMPAVEGAVEDLYLSADGTMAPTLDAWREVKIGALFHARPGSDGKPVRGITRYFGDLIDAETFGWRWYADAVAMGLEQARRVIVIGDGAAWIWNLADIHFPGAIQIVDWYHAIERLWTVANACFGEGESEACAWVETCKKLLRASRVESVIEKLLALRARSKKTRKMLQDAAGYFRKNADRMRYRRYRRQGLFIGSGVVEAGCKHIVGQRLKQSGMRWTLEGLRAILFLRLAVLNRQWPARQRRAA